MAMIEPGVEYPYLGHTQTGWIKILLPNGIPGWSKTAFEYIKFDYTEVDELREGVTVADETSPFKNRKDLSYETDATEGLHKSNPEVVTLSQKGDKSLTTSSSADRGGQG
jgi:hypothetical protein